jgi:type II secretory pathway component PulK
MLKPRLMIVTLLVAVLTLSISAASWYLQFNLRAALDHAQESNCVPGQAFLETF